MVQTTVFESNKSYEDAEIRAKMRGFIPVQRLFNQKEQKFVVVARPYSGY